MIDVSFAATQSVRMRGSRVLDRETQAPLDEYRITVWEDVGPYEGLPGSVRQTFTRAQLLALAGVIREVIGQ